MATVEAPLVEADTRGIRAVRDEEFDTVLVWYEETVADLGFDPAQPGPSIDEFQPWNLTTPTLKELVTALSGEPATGYLFQQQALHDFMVRMDRENADAATTTRGSTEPAPEQPAAAGGSGASVPGGPEDSDEVGEVGAAEKHPDVRGTSQVPRRGRKSKTRR